MNFSQIVILFIFVIFLTKFMNFFQTHDFSVLLTFFSVFFFEISWTFFKPMNFSKFLLNFSENFEIHELFQIYERV